MTKKFQEIKKLGKVVVFLIDLLYIDLRPHRYIQSLTELSFFALLSRLSVLLNHTRVQYYYIIYIMCATNYILDIYLNAKERK